MPRRYRAYGLRVDAALSLPGLAEVPGEGDADVRIECGRGEGDPWSPAQEEALWRTVVDARPVTLERGHGGDFRMTFGADAVFRLSGALDRVWCEPAATARPEPWRRFLLDTVLGHVALGRGKLALHAGAVEVDGCAVAIAAGTGGGKTTLAYELLANGARLLADDICVISTSCTGGATIAHVEPGPAVMNVAAGRAGAPLPAARALWEERGEVWLEVDQAAGRASRLVLVLVLDRRPGSATDLAPVSQPLLELSRFALGGSSVPETYQRRRFETLADVAASVPVLRLQADTGVTPGTLVELALSAVAGARDAQGEGAGVR